VSSSEENAKLGQMGSCWGHDFKFWNFGTSLISRERLKLETSNLAQRLMSVSSSEIRSKGFMWGSRDPFLEFRDPLNISQTVTARNFKFGKDTDGSEFQRIKCKIG